VDVIVIIAGILEESLSALKKGAELPADHIVREFQEQLVLLDFLENHVYYAGHIIELTAFGILMGYEVSDAQRQGIIRTINSLNEIIAEYAAKMSFVDCFLGFGHYRRAITLFSEIEAGHTILSHDLLQKYTVNFDEIMPIHFSDKAIERSKKVLATNIFQVIDPQERINPQLQLFIEQYESTGDQKAYPLKGKFPHFRRVCPENWPKSIHYEVLDYGDEHKKLGLEIHLESVDVKPIKERLSSICETLNQSFEKIQFRFDAEWYNGCGRLYGLIPYDQVTEKAVPLFNQLINKTHQLLEEELQEVYYSKANK
jgi:hypothetical protein